MDDNEIEEDILPDEDEKENTPSEDEYEAAKQEDSFFSSKERKYVVSVAKDIYKGLSSFSTEKMTNAFKTLIQKLIAYLDMKEKELAGVKKNDKDTHAKLNNWKTKHKNDKKGWGALIIKGRQKLDTQQIKKKYNTPGPAGYAMAVLSVCLYDGKTSFAFPKTDLLKAVSVGLTVSCLYKLKLSKIPRFKNNENINATEDILYGPNGGPEDKTYENNEKKYNAYVKTLLPKIQKKCYNEISKLGPNTNSTELEQIPVDVCGTFSEGLAAFMKTNFKLKVDFYNEKVEIIS